MHINLSVTPDEEIHSLRRSHFCFVFVLSCSVCLCSSFVLSFCFYSREFPYALSLFASTFDLETNIYYCLASHTILEESFESNTGSVKLNEHLLWIIDYELSLNNPEIHFHVGFTTIWCCQCASDVEKICHICSMTQCQQCCSGKQMVDTGAADGLLIFAPH